MELRQLEYFAAVARHRHFTRAAEALFVTQSALSQQVRRLEEELGMALLNRTSRGVELTAAGADLLERAESILAEVERARAEMDQHAGVTRGVVRVASTAGDALGLPRALAAFHSGHPGIRIGLRQGSATEVLELMRSGAADVAVTAVATREPRAVPGLETTLVAREPLRVVSAEGESITSGSPDEVEIGDLRGRGLILAEPGTPLREVVASACADAGFSPVPLFEVSDPWTVRFLASAGLGASVVPRSWVELPGPPIAVAALRDPAPRHCIAVLAPAAGRSPAAGLLHDHLKRALADGCTELLGEPPLGP